MIRTWLLTDSGPLPHSAGREAAFSLGEEMPRIVLEARRVAGLVSGGLHGKRQAGNGENFWQFRPFINGEPARRVDWRRSARDDRLYVREREWQTNHTFWIWMDRSPSMYFSSSLACTSKIERALVLGLALAHVLVLNGERVGLFGHAPATAGRSVIDRLAEQLLVHQEEVEDLPPDIPVSPPHELVLISDFLSPLADLESMLENLSTHGIRGHVIMILDPVEEAFPFHGQTILTEPETRYSVKVGEAGDWAAAYHPLFRRHRQALADCVAAKGWTFSLHHTDQSAGAALLRILQLTAAARRPSVEEL
jgi:uncharacterized protein (DUF58 family)